MTRPPTVAAGLPIAESLGVAPDLPAEATLLDARQIAAAGRVSARTVHGWMSSGALPTVRLGRSRRVLLEDWVEFIRARRTS